MKKTPTLFLSLLLILITAPLRAQDQIPKAIVEVALAKQLEVAPSVWVNGTVISRFDAKPATEVEGNITHILEIGTRVEKGNVIAIIDDSRYQLRLDEVQAEIAPVKTMMEFYQREAKRLETLSMHDNAAKNKLDEIRTKSNEAQATINAIQTRLAIANDNLAKVKIRAPFTGTIVTRFKELGEWVQDGDEIVRLVDTSTREIQANIQQESLAFINIGDSIQAKSNGEQLYGKVRVIIPVGDAISRLHELRVEFDKANWQIGKSIKIAAPISNKQQVIAVPRDALVIRQSGVVVYKVNAENQAELTPVEVGISASSYIQVIGNISDNDAIIVRGNERIRPGQMVQIINKMN